MSFSDEQIAALQAKLDASHVKKNPKGHDYVEGWHAIAEANRIFGFDAWDRELPSLVQVAPAYQVDNKWRVAYRATVRIVVTADGTEIAREGTGYGSGINKDLNDAHESAVKEAETDAMKRALMTFGNPFGLALYDKAKENVEGTVPQQNAQRRQPASKPTPGPGADTSKPHVVPVPPTADGQGSDWAEYGRRITLCATKRAPDVPTVNEWLKRNKVPLENYAKADPDGHAMAVDIITKHRAALADAPIDRKAS